MDTHIHKHNDTVLLPHHDAVNIRRLYLPTFASQNDDIQKKKLHHKQFPLREKTVHAYYFSITPYLDIPGTKT